MKKRKFFCLDEVLLKIEESLKFEEIRERKFFLGEELI